MSVKCRINRNASCIYTKTYSILHESRYVRMAVDSKGISSANPFPSRSIATPWRNVMASWSPTASEDPVTMRTEMEAAMHPGDGSPSDRASKNNRAIFPVNRMRTRFVAYVHRCKELMGRTCPTRWNLYRNPTPRPEGSALSISIRDYLSIHSNKLEIRFSLECALRPHIVIALRKTNTEFEREEQYSEKCFKQIAINS